MMLPTDPAHTESVPTSPGIATEAGNLLEPTGPGDIRSLQRDLKATLTPAGASAGATSGLRTHLRGLENTLGAFVHWPITARTLGSDHGYRFETEEITPSSLYVRCEQFTRTSFRAGATILQARLFVPRVLVHGEGTPVDFVAFEFLARVSRVLGAEEARTAHPQVPGFVLQVIQMDFGDATLLAETLARLRTSEDPFPLD